MSGIFNHTRSSLPTILNMSELTWLYGGGGDGDLGERWESWEPLLL